MTEKGDSLLIELYENPKAFDDDGKAYQLLQEVFEGHQLDDIRALLRSSDVSIQRAGAFIASELGDRAADLLDELVPLALASDTSVRYDAIDAISAASASQPSAFLYVLKALGDQADPVRKMAARRCRRVPQATLFTAMRELVEMEDSNPSMSAHARGLDFLLSAASDPARVQAALESSDPLLRRYAAIKAGRLGLSAKFVGKSHLDTEILVFLEEATEDSSE